MPISESAAVTMQAAAVATGVGTALDLSGLPAATLQIKGITTATVTFQATVDGTNWVGVALADLNSTTRARALTATADGIFLFEAAPGTQSLRANITAWTSGATTITGVAGR